MNLMKMGKTLAEGIGLKEPAKMPWHVKLENLLGRKKCIIGLAIALLSLLVAAIFN